MRTFWKIAICGAVAALGPAGTAAAASTPPRVDMTQPRPQDYPDSAQLNGEEGTIFLDVYVRSNGRPAKVRVERSSGFRDLDDAAVESVLNWRFVPATSDGDLVSDWTKVKIVYQLLRLPTQAAQPPG
jgi:protein TonB